MRPHLRPAPPLVRVDAPACGPKCWRLDAVMQPLIWEQQQEQQREQQVREQYNITYLLSNSFI